jgi:3-oxoacyl-[acyl-carrier-protein] synthase-3
MKVEGIWIGGTGAAIAPGVPTHEAVERGEYAADEAARTMQMAVAIAPPDTPATAYAVAAGWAAMRQARIRTAGLVVHCVVRDSGCDGWSAAAYVQRQLGIADALPVELRVGCNPLIAWELAIKSLRGEDGYRDALVAAADIWPLPAVDRYASASGFVFGDGGGAVVLSRAPGIARVLSVCTGADVEMEALTRGSHPLYGLPPAPLDLRQRAAEFVDVVMSKEEQWQRRDAGMTRTVHQALDDAGVGMPDIARVVVNHLGRGLLEREVCSVIGAPLERTTWEYGRMIGHLGAADAAVSLRHVFESPGVRSGGYVLMVSMAAGYTWGAAVLKMEQDSGMSEEGAAE